MRKWSGAVQRKLTITLSDDVYRGLYEQIGRGEISRFIEDLVRPHVVQHHSLEAAYWEAARDQAAEQVAQAWIEADTGDTLR